MKDEVIHESDEGPEETHEDADHGVEDDELVELLAYHSACTVFLKDTCACDIEGGLL